MIEQGQYQICVQGWIGKRWANWFDGMSLTYKETKDDSPVTLLSGAVKDQAALRSLLSKIWDLNLTVISLLRVEVCSEREGEKSNA